MADNKSPNPKRTEIVLAWLGMAGAVAVMWWVGWSPTRPLKRMRRRHCYRRLSLKVRTFRGL